MSRMVRKLGKGHCDAQAFVAKELPEPSLPPSSGSRGAVNIHCQQRKGTTMSHLHKNGSNLEPNGYGVLLLLMLFCGTFSRNVYVNKHWNELARTPALEHSQL